MTVQTPIAKLSPREAAVEIVATFMPEAGAEERALRARIHVARDTSSTRSVRVASFDSKRIYSVATSIAGEWVLKRCATKEQLVDVLEIITALFKAAQAYERLQASPEGECDDDRR